MPEFLYKPEYEDISADGAQRKCVPGQINAEFDRTEEHLVAEWCKWLADHSFPQCAPFSRFGVGLETFVWCPTKDHMMMHRLRWGGKMAG